MRLDRFGLFVDDVIARSRLYRDVPWGERNGI